MIKHSPRHDKSLARSRRGFSTLVATIFMVLILLFLVFNVFMFMLDRNTALEDTTSLVRQMNVDRITEQLSVIGTSYTVDSAFGRVSPSFTVTNISPLSIEIVRVWIKDLTNNEVNSTALVPPIALQPGQSNYVSPNEVSMIISGAKDSDTFTSWLVTRRGRTISTVSTATYVPGALAGFVFNTIGTQKAGVPFTITITAIDAYGGIVQNYTGTNTIFDRTTTIIPSLTGSFVKGVWTGQVTINQALTRNVIFTQGGGYIGNSNPFDVTAPTIPFRIDGSSAGCAMPGNLISLPITTNYANDLIYVSVAVATSRTITISSTPQAGLNWTRRASVPYAVNTNPQLEIWYAIMPSNGTMTINIAISGSPVWAAAVAFGISGANTIGFDPANPTTLFDVATPPTNKYVAQGYLASVSITTTTAKTMIIGAIGATSQGSLTHGDGFTNIATAFPGSGGNPQTAAEYWISSSPQTNLSVGYKLGVNTMYWAMIADAVKQAS